MVKNVGKKSFTVLEESIKGNLAYYEESGEGGLSLGYDFCLFLKSSKCLRTPCQDQIFVLKSDSGCSVRTN